MHRIPLVPLVVGGATVLVVLFIVIPLFRRKSGQAAAQAGANLDRLGIQLAADGAVSRGQGNYQGQDVTVKVDASAVKATSESSSVGMDLVGGALSAFAPGGVGKSIGKKVIKGIGKSGKSARKKSRMAVTWTMKLPRKLSRAVLRRRQPDDEDYVPLSEELWVKAREKTQATLRDPDVLVGLNGTRFTRIVIKGDSAEVQWKAKLSVWDQVVNEPGGFAEETSRVFDLLLLMSDRMPDAPAPKATADEPE
jgi:hypothetical protein